MAVVLPSSMSGGIFQRCRLPCAPLPCATARASDPEDLVVFEIHYEDRIGENYFARHSARQQLFYYPAMTRSEALLIKQWDSGGTLACLDGTKGDAVHPDAPCTFSFHSAFEDLASPEDVPDSWSIEVRCMVLYD